MAHSTLVTFGSGRQNTADMLAAFNERGLADFRDHGMPDNCQYWTSTQQNGRHGRSHRLRRQRAATLRRQGLSAARARAIRAF